MLRRFLPGAALTLLAAGGWLRAASGGWIVVAVLGAAVSIASLWSSRGWRRVTAGLLLGLVALVPLATALRTDYLQRHWPAVQAARVDRAADRLAGDLHAAYLLANRLADEGSQAPAAPAAAFEALDRATAHLSIDAGLAVLSPDGEPLAWAGSHRLPPAGDGNPVSTVANPFYLVLEVSKAAADGRRVVGSVVVWASPAVPERIRSVTEDFRRRTGVGLLVYTAGTAPDLPDVFDYTEPTTAGPRLLFSVQPVPPSLGDVATVVRRGGAGATAIVISLTLVWLLWIAPVSWARVTILLLAAVLVLLAPLGSAIGLGSYFASGGGPAQASAGAIFTIASVAILLGAALWLKPPARRWYNRPIAALLLVAALVAPPILAWSVHPPDAAAPPVLWLGWQVSLALFMAALALPAAALLRGSDPRGNGSAGTWGGVALSLIVGMIGIALWRPDHGWPWWFAVAWLPPLMLATRPTRQGLAIVGLALVTGSAAALLAWGMYLRSRLAQASEDAGQVGLHADATVAPLLRRATGLVAAGAPPGDPADLYVRWHRARSGLERYPVRLSVIDRSGSMRAELALDSLNLPDSLVRAFASGVPDQGGAREEAMPGIPGLYHLAARRLTDGAVLVVAIGPRTRLLPPTRLGALLDPAADAESPYAISLTPAGPEAAPADDTMQWRREGRTVFGQRAAFFADGTRLVRVRLDLRGRFPLLVRGGLLVLLDIAIFGLLWLLAAVLAGVPATLPSWGRLRRSFRARVAIALAGFFLLPAVGLAAWELARLNREAEQQRDEAIALALRDVAAAAAAREEDSEELGVLLDDFGRRFRSELALYRGGARISTTDPVVAALAILAPLQEPSAFVSMALGGEREAGADEPLVGRGGRVGYRVIETGTPLQMEVVATARAAESRNLAASQADLGWVLLLATLLGVAGAIGAAGRVAAALSRPVGDLRRAALAVGSGAPIPVPNAPHPTEFEPVVAAFGRMEEDLRAGRAALEASRRTTASVLATVATGVVGLGRSGEVLVANPRAEELLGHRLVAGTPFLSALGDDWPALRDAVRAFQAAPSAVFEAELDDGTRRLAMVLTPLTPDVGGVVLAVNDITEVSRAERVLAWGEMARQVAHEIKNPLTPMRLGVQHLQRVHRERPEALGSTLTETAARILAEIERLDTIARAFSRFAAPDRPAVAPDRVQLAPVAEEVVHLYQLAGDGAQVRLEANPQAQGRARSDEVKEVLLNLLENARQAGARQVVVRITEGRMEVADDGEGIPGEALPRVFEPRFSTTTSGSGLGLAIVKRLVEGWGGTVRVTSSVGRGTTVTVELA